MPAPQTVLNTAIAALNNKRSRVHSCCYFQHVLYRCMVVLLIYKWKWYSRKECYKQCRHITFKGTMTMTNRHSEINYFCAFRIFLYFTANSRCEMEKTLPSLLSNNKIKISNIITCVLVFIKVTRWTTSISIINLFCSFL